MTDGTEEKPTRENILIAIDEMAGKMQEQDVAVILLSTHGAMIGKDFYVITYGIRLGAIGATALSIEELAAHVQKVAEKGKVILLIDACHSGTPGEKFDASILSRLAIMNTVALLTSSSRDEFSEERREWGHGAFTKAFLDSLQGDEAALRRGTIRMGDVEMAMEEAVQKLTENRQHLGPHLNFVKDDVFNVNR